MASDLVEARPRYVKGAKYIRNAAVSPSGARAVFEFRGEIVTVPAEKGDPRNLTDSPGVHERSPAWSPDGRSIAYFSDEGGEYRLHVRPADGKGQAKKSTDSRGRLLPDAGLVARQPEDRLRRQLAVALLDRPGQRQGEEGRLRADYGPTALLHAAPGLVARFEVDRLCPGQQSRLSHGLRLRSGHRQSRPITDGLSDAIDPVFDAGGKYLYFLASTDAGPVNQWFAQSKPTCAFAASIYLVVLQKGVPRRWAARATRKRAASRRRRRRGNQG